MEIEMHIKKEILSVLRPSPHLLHKQSSSSHQLSDAVLTEPASLSFPFDISQKSWDVASLHVSDQSYFCCFRGHGVVLISIPTM